MTAQPELQPSGYSLPAPAEPEPRNVIAASVADGAVGTGSSSAHVNAVSQATTGFTTDALQNSTNPASVVQNESLNDSAGADQAVQEGSGWQWADRAQVRESMDICSTQPYGGLMLILSVQSEHTKEMDYIY